MKCNRRVVLFCSQERQRWHRETENRKCESGNRLMLSAQEKRNVSNVVRPAASPRLHCCLLARRRASFENEEQGPSDGVGGGLNCHKAALLTR